MQTLYDYKRLIKKFLNKEITVQEFESTFFEAYSNENSPVSKRLFECLDWLFF